MRLRIAYLAIVLALGCVSVEQDVLVLPPSPSAFASIRVEPASAALTLINGRPAFQQFRAFGVREDGTEIALASVDRWELLDDRLGFADESGVVTAEGPTGGVTRVNARLGPDDEGEVLQASAALTIRVEYAFSFEVDAATVEVEYDSLSGFTVERRGKRVAAARNGVASHAAVGVPRRRRGQKGRT
ncbi:MAG: hypothetical protein AAF645_23910, partial [Myxococcota bacterium]